MNCSIFEEVVSEYLDGTLPKQQTNLLAAHALQCRECRALMNDIKAMMQEVKEVVETPSHLETALLTIQVEHTPLTCSDFAEWITEFLDGFVPASIYHKFERHAEECASCSSLLTEVVYAVAACHSVHTYEEVDLPEALTQKLLAVMPKPKASLRRKVADKFAAFAGALMPRATQSRGWSYATVSGLAFAVFGFLLFGFSEDGSVSGIYREARAKVDSFYSQSTNLYSQKDELLAGLERVSSNIGEMWNAIGGESEGETAKRTSIQNLPSPKSNTNTSKGAAEFSVFGR